MDTSHIPQFLEAVPLVCNPYFEVKIATRVNRALLLKWGGYGFATLGNAINGSTNKVFTALEISNVLSKLNPPIPPAMLGAKARQGALLLGSIPQKYIDLVTLPRRKFEEGEILRFVDDDSVLQYGVYSKAKQTIWQLHVDNSGFSSIVARTDTNGDPLNLPFDTSQWDYTDWRDYTSKVSVWNTTHAQFRPIAGEMATTFPQDEGWIVNGNEDEILRLSQLSINRSTKILTANRKGIGPSKARLNGI